MMILSLLLVLSMALVQAKEEAFSKWISPNLGWYTFFYTGLQVGHFKVKAHKILQILVTGCNCPGDQLQVFDNGTPLILYGGCSGDPMAVCTTPVSDTRACLGLEPPPTPGDKTSKRLGGTEGITSFAYDNLNGFCVVGGLLLPGEHNITVISSHTNYPANYALIRADTWCPNEQDACCFVEESVLMRDVCVSAVIG